MDNRITITVEIQTGNVKVGDENNYDDGKQNNETKEKDESLIESDRGNKCPVCLDEMTEIGAHMATRLEKCGHIFGFSCIDHWVKMAHSCPVCRNKSTMRHLRGVRQSLGTRYDRPSTSQAELDRNDRRLRVTYERILARERRHREARRAADERPSENAETRGSQHS